MMNKTLHVGSPNIGSREKIHKYLDDILDRRWLTNRGQIVQEFEKRLAEYLGVKHCISMCNGTIALEIATRALELKEEVIIPSLTFIATAHSLQWQGIKPIFCDIDRERYTIDPVEIEKHITPNTSAIMGVHTFGRPCDIKALQEVADKYKLRLLFDAAHAFGCTYKGQRIGGFAECEVFSFHATKFFNSFEGGAVTTNSDELAEKIRLMQNFGFAGIDNVIYIGTNGKMSEICAAMGLVNLDEIDRFISINKRNYDCYDHHIAEINGLKLIRYDKDPDSNYQYIVVEVEDEFPLSRDALVNKLHTANIRARKYFWPGCHRMEPYKSFQPNAGMMLPVTEEVTDRLVLLPTGSAIDEAMIEMICDQLRM